MTDTNNEAVLVVVMSAAQSQDPCGDDDFTGYCSLPQDDMIITYCQRICTNSRSPTLLCLSLESVPELIEEICSIRDFSEMKFASDAFSFRIMLTCVPSTLKNKVFYDVSRRKLETYTLNLHHLACLMTRTFLSGRTVSVGMNVDASLSQMNANPSRDALQLHISHTSDTNVLEVTVQHKFITSILEHPWSVCLSI